eukprot:2344158-Pyramimonas_sp.AAC.1
MGAAADDDGDDANCRESKRPTGGGTSGGSAEARSNKRYNEISELSEDERRSIWTTRSSFEDFTAKLEELYTTKRARYSVRRRPRST